MRQIHLFLMVAVLGLLNPVAANANLAAGSTASVSGAITLFLSGDVMTGRGIDQILPHPSDPQLFESFLKDAGLYVNLAEAVNGPIPHPVDTSYIWGFALEELEHRQPDARIVNLETSITLSTMHDRSKDIHYRMNPRNVPILSAAQLDICVLGNNHILDWGANGLKETVATLEEAGMQTAGAGHNIAAAAAPAIVDLGSVGRVVVFSYGSMTAGVPAKWEASKRKPGVQLLQDYSPETVRHIGEQVQAVKEPGDIVVASLHWGPNWGFEIDAEEREFAHRLIDEAGVDLIHGHSSHHVKGIEVYQEKLILYGCGDLINDYEGIRGNEQYRGDLGLMYFPEVDPATGQLTRLEMVPTRMRNFRLQQPTPAETFWLMEALNRARGELGTRVRRDGDKLVVSWE
jgi:poly-gamma-glutamate capsule biosynthesis protein CapA/YwtB (metallophosphatase superfamily)